MNIDFAKTKDAIHKLLNDALPRFSSEFPNVHIRKVCLWGYGFGACIHILLETTDDETVFGSRFGEYNDNEYAVARFDWWPNLYDCEDDEPYRIKLHDGSIVETVQSNEGNDAIDIPLFELLKQVLRETDFSEIPTSEPLQLGIEIGDSPHEENWVYGT